MSTVGNKYKAFRANYRLHKCMDAFNLAQVRAICQITSELNG